ncbi:hypothetical protein N9165_03540 [Akkermansiaceae bacterium]|nr:hypothetical protein [Akkermansiaceae bacterium]
MFVADAGEEAAGVVEVVVAWAGVAFSEEEVGGVAAIEGAVLRDIDFGELREGREEVEGAEEFVAFASGFDFLGPASPSQKASSSSSSPPKKTASSIPSISPSMTPDAFGPKLDRCILSTPSAA